MSLTMPIFDTHRYVKELEAAGVTTKQAEVQVKMQAEIFSSVIDDTLATKRDLRELAAELKAEIASVKAELKLEMAELRAEFRGKFNLIYWMIGFLLATNSAIFFKLFLH